MIDSCLVLKGPFHSHFLLEVEVNNGEKGLRNNCIIISLAIVSLPTFMVEGENSMGREICTLLCCLCVLILQVTVDCNRYITRTTLF